MHFNAISLTWKRKITPCRIRMPWPLRKRAVMAYERGASSYAQLAALLEVQHRTLERWVARWRTARSVELRSGRPGSLLTLAPHRSGRAGSAASGSSTDGFATRRRVPAGPGSQAMATAIPKAYLASSAIRCRDVETGPNLGVLAVFPSTGATCRCPLPSTGSRGLNSPASAVL